LPALSTAVPKAEPQPAVAEIVTFTFQELTPILLTFTFQELTPILLTQTLKQDPVCES
jgi:hypothetical protein